MNCIPAVIPAALAEQCIAMTSETGAEIAMNAKVYDALGAARTLRCPHNARLIAGTLGTFLNPEIS